MLDREPPSGVRRPWDAIGRTRAFQYAFAVVLVAGALLFLLALPIASA